MKRINKKGFTLVELLAVIVVLAIVMLIAVSAVLPQMEKARRQTLALEAHTAIESAQTYFMSKSVSGKSGEGLPAKGGATNCVTISELINDGQFTTRSGTYDGKVVVTKKANSNIYLYSVWLQKDNSWMVVNEGNDGSTNVQIVEGDVVDFDETTWSTGSECQSTEITGRSTTATSGGSSSGSEG